MIFLNEVVTVKTILAIIFTLYATQLYAQQPELELIVRPALTSLRGNDLIKQNYNPTINFSTGLGASYFITDRSFLSLAILYDRKGGKGESTFFVRDDQNQLEEEVKATNRATFEYITVPVQWGRQFGQKINYRFGVGLYTSFLLKQETFIEGFNGVDESTTDGTDGFTKLDFGLSASLSVFVPISKALSFKAGLDNNLGLINTSALPVMDNGTIKHNSLGLSFGLTYNLR